MSTDSSRLIATMSAIHKAQIIEQSEPQFQQPESHDNLVGNAEAHDAPTLRSASQ